MERVKQFSRWLVSISPSRTALPWVALALALMLISAYCIVTWMGIVGLVSGWTGLPQYEAQIPKLQRQAEAFFWLAVVLPFIAAFFLGLGKADVPAQVGNSEHSMLTYRSRPNALLSALARYGSHLGLSLLGTLGFILLMILVSVNW